MSKVSDLHNKAMEFADLADLERRRSNEERAAEFLEQALEFELAAIVELYDQDGLNLVGAAPQCRVAGFGL